MGALGLWAINVQVTPDTQPAGRADQQLDGKTTTRSVKVINARFPILVDEKSRNALTTGSNTLMSWFKHIDARFDRVEGEHQDHPQRHQDHSLEAFRRRPKPDSEEKASDPEGGEHGLTLKEYAGVDHGRGQSWWRRWGGWGCGRSTSRSPPSINLTRKNGSTPDVKVINARFDLVDEKFCRTSMRGSSTLLERFKHIDG